LVMERKYSLQSLQEKQSSILEQVEGRHRFQIQLSHLLLKVNRSQSNPKQPRLQTFVLLQAPRDENNGATQSKRQD